MSAAAPQLEVLDGSGPREFKEPKKCILTEDDMERFKYTKGFNDIGQFILQLNRALCPRTTTAPKPAEGEASSDTAQSSSSPTPGDTSSTMKPPDTLKTPAKAGPAETFTINSKRGDPQSVKQLQALLEKLKSIIDEVPPSKEPRRFGNASFRTWHKLLEERVDGLLKEFLPEQVQDFPYAGEVSPFVELRAYFLGGFGSSTRLDYGTGHELSFLAFLGCLWKLGGFKDGDNGREGDIERSIVFGVFEPYLNLIRRLTLTYTLEPAGSHGVWGLDDHFFLPYIFGSAQLTRPIPCSSPTEPMPQEGSVRGAPKPADVCNAGRVEDFRGDNMYFSAIGFINDVKKGPFWEHSPVLYNVSGIKDGWGKINKGMIKMFLAEVLGKFPVVQHFPFGSLFSWEFADDVPEAVREGAMKAQAVGGGGGGSAQAGAMPMVGTQAPWAQGAQPGMGAFPRPGGVGM
ncbi:rotamase PTPA-1, partial [Coniochaeta sp. 2T2.1]